MIEIRGISKTFTDFALKDISLTVQNREYLVLLGPTGAGKTLLLETIAGIYSPDHGQILVNGSDITRTPPGQRHIAVVYQDYMLFPHMTLAENIAFGLTARKGSGSCDKGKIEDKVKEFSQMLGISHLLDRYPHKLSGGEQQRGAIARAIITEPRLLLLDEPLSAVDEYTSERLQLEIKRIHKLTGATTIHITHRFDEAFAMADRIAIMKDGKIRQQGDPETLFRKPTDCWVARFVGCKNLFPGEAVLDESTGGSVCHVEGVRIKTESRLQGDVWLSIRPEDIYISRQRFEEPYLNCFTAKVTNIINRGRLLEAELDAGIKLITVLTRQSAQKMALQPNKTVHITINQKDTHLSARVLGARPDL